MDHPSLVPAEDLHVPAIIGLVLALGYQIISCVTWCLGPEYDEGEGEMNESGLYV